MQIGSNKVLYVEKGGGMIGFNIFFKWGGTYPFSKLIIAPPYITLRVWPFKSIIKIRDIDYITKYAEKLHLFNTIKISHHGPNMHFLTFSPNGKMQELLNALKGLGIAIR